MSKVKRILSVIMAMVMVLAMSVPTFAAGEKATIALKNFDTANKVEYMQIIQKMKPKLLVGHLQMEQEHALQLRLDLLIQRMLSSRLSGD